MTIDPTPTSPSRTFQVLADDLTWFIKCPELRVFHITTSASDRVLALELVARSEGHPHNHSPYFVLEDAVVAGDTGFLSRAYRIGEIHEARKKALEPEGITLSDIQAVSPNAASVPAVVAMAQQLRSALFAQEQVPVLQGITVVLAPTRVESSAPFVDELLDLVRTPKLALVRYVVLEVGDSLQKPLAKALGPRMLVATALVPESERVADLKARLAGMASAPKGASPEVVLGYAGPRNVVAPTRFGQPARDFVTPETTALLEKELGPLAALVGEGGILIRKQIAGAALAVREGKYLEAVALQTAACSFCFGAGLVELGCTLEMGLAAYLLVGKKRAEAKVAFRSAQTRARAHGLTAIEAQALLGLAPLLSLDGQTLEAIQTYTRAAELAQSAKLPIVAIEAYRCAGQLAMNGHADRAATELWIRAIGVANAALPSEAAASSAPIVARALAKVLLDLDSHASAQSLLEQADRIESGQGGQDVSQSPASALPGVRS